jgi:hypothetical protein
MNYVTKNLTYGLTVMTDYLLKSLTDGLSDYLHGNILLEKLIIAQLVKKFPPFMEPEVSSLCSQEPILSQMNPVHILTQYLLISPLILSSRTRLSLTSDFLSSGFLIKIVY